jgi:hypothetical protein
VVGFTTGSRGEVPGKRKPVIREQHDNNDKNSSEFVFVYNFFNDAFSVTQAMQRRIRV